jgi:hypothetical protein
MARFVSVKSNKNTKIVYNFNKLSLKIEISSLQVDQNGKLLILIGKLSFYPKKIMFLTDKRFYYDF